MGNRYKRKHEWSHLTVLPQKRDFRTIIDEELIHAMKRLNN
jgi:hypothetical protein